MALTAISKEDILRRILNNIGANTPITYIGPGSRAKAIANALAASLDDFYTILDNQTLLSFVSSASGRYLDMIGELVGVSRQIAAPASVGANEQVVKFYVDSGTFGDINNNSSILVNAGTQITNSSGTIVYLLSQDTILGVNDSEQYVTVEAAEEGTQFNVGSRDVLISHDFTGYSAYSSSNPPLKVINDQPIENAVPREDDGLFRFRIKNAIFSAATGNSIAIRTKLLASPGVADVLDVPLSNGIGTATYYIKTVSAVPSATLLERLQLEVDAMTAVGSRIFVKRPLQSYVSGTIHILPGRELSDKEEIELKRQVITSARDYINNLDIGERMSFAAMARNIFLLNQAIRQVGSDNNPFINPETKELTISIARETVEDVTRRRETPLQQAPDFAPQTIEKLIVDPTIASPLSVNILSPFII